AAPVLLAALVAAAAAFGVGLFSGVRAGRGPAPQFRRLTYQRGYIESARFSPDGQTVIYGSTRRNEPLRIYSTRLDSVEARRRDGPRHLAHRRDAPAAPLRASRLLDPIGNARTRGPRRRQPAGDLRARDRSRHFPRRQGARGRPRGRQAAAARVSRRKSPP